MKEKQLIVITGPTAVGKTEASLQFAESRGLEIISCDSRQFYKEMNIGTAKPSDDELSRVKHHFINSLSVTQSYSAGDFERDALNVLGQCFSRNNKVVLSGGSGLYIKALCEGFDHFPNVPDHILADINELSLEQLQEDLKKKDPTYYSIVDVSNRHRLIRALSVIMTSGQSFTSFRNRNFKSRNFSILYYVLNRERTELYQRINSRVDHMIKDGLLEEVKDLYQFRDQKSLQTVGYQEFFPYLAGNRSLDEAVELVKRNSRRYAKRQLTWFRSYKEATWIHPDDFLKNLPSI